VLDVGCGDGAAVHWFNDHGCEAKGIDGLRPNFPLGWFIEHDYTAGELVPLAHGVDLVWSCEFVEHVEERHVPNFLATFRQGSTVLMTHATPEVAGWHHVNCRTADYWVGALAASGYALDGGLTATCRVLAGEGYFGRSGLAFRRAAAG
jgi:hypothetical protein